MHNFNEALSKSVREKMLLSPRMAVETLKRLSLGCGSRFCSLKANVFYV